MANERCRISSEQTRNAGKDNITHEMKSLTTRVAHRLPFSVTTPERRRVGTTVGAWGLRRPRAAVGLGQCRVNVLRGPLLERGVNWVRPWRGPLHGWRWRCRRRGLVPVMIGSRRSMHLAVERKSSERAEGRIVHVHDRRLQHDCGHVFAPRHD